MSSAPAQVGLIVSRAVGNAVVRNRVKRRLRHQVKPLLERLPAGTTIALRAQPAAADASSAELAEELRTLLDRSLQVATTR